MYGRDVASRQRPQIECPTHWITAAPTRRQRVPAHRTQLPWVEINTAIDNPDMGGEGSGPSGIISPDGRYRWNGTSWELIQPAVSSPAATVISRPPRKRGWAFWLVTIFLVVPLLLALVLVSCQSARAVGGRCVSAARRRQAT
jgi:hypothetical protein